MLASKVGRMMFIRLNRHLIDEVRKLDAAVAQARARVAKSAQKSVAVQEKSSDMSVDLTSSACPCSVFSRLFFVCVFCCCFRGYIKISMAFDLFFVIRFS